MIWVVYDDSFAAQMAFLKKSGYQTLDLDDYAKIRAGGGLLPPKPVIITFDDGLREQTTRMPTRSFEGTASTRRSSWHRNQVRRPGI